MEVKEKFEFKSEVLKKARETKGYKQDELAKLIFTTRQTISNWENGKKIPTLANIDRLAQVLNVSIDDLIEREGDEEQKTNDEQLDQLDSTNYSLVYTPTIKKSIKDLKWIKIILALILIILVIYLGTSIRKFCILYDIKNKMLTYNNVNNYSYFKTYCKVNNMQCVSYYTENVFYKDGISKTCYYDGKNIDILYIENNEAKLIHENTKTYEIIGDYKENQIGINKLYNMYPELVSNNNFINFMHSFSLMFRTEYTDKYYNIEFKSKGNSIIEENISINGLLNEKVVYYSNKDYEKTVYEIKINEVTDQDLKVDYDGYEIIK